jgi:hypothetical protein
MSVSVHASLPLGLPSSASACEEDAMFVFIIGFVIAVAAGGPRKLVTFADFLIVAFRHFLLQSTV